LENVDSLNFFLVAFPRDCVEVSETSLCCINSA
jgi:hypothetical protein